MADILVRPFTQLPERGSLRLVESIELRSGGCAANTAITLAKLGIATKIVGCVGNDEFASFLERTLARDGVDISALVRTPDRMTSSTVVLVSSDGERSFLHCIGANASLRESHFSGPVLNACDILHFGGALLLPGFDGEPMARVLGAARERGLITTLDAAWDSTGRWYATLAPCIPLLDVFMASEQEAVALSGCSDPATAADFFLSRGSRSVAIKLGARGCLLVSHHERYYLHAFPVQVVDTTGAGDAFAAGFLAGMATGLDLESCGRLGCAAGASCVMYSGAANFPVSMTELNLLAKQATFPTSPS